MLVSEGGRGRGVGGGAEDTGRGGVGNAFRNGAGIFILFIKCKTCYHVYIEKNLQDKYLVQSSRDREKNKERWRWMEFQ